MRKPVGLVALNHETFMVVCNDGSVWQFKADKWEQLTSVPGTKSAPEEEKTPKNRKVGLS